jgi:hypothetical protein
MDLRFGTEAAMKTPFDRQDWAVVLLGWAVAPWITLG